MGRTTGGAVRIYQINYIIGFSLGCILYFTVCKFYPPSGQGISEDFDGSENGVVEGVAVVSDDSGSDMPSKEPIVTDTKV